ncbi:outer membrane protein [Brucella sp. BE17]|uniref:outer membrane protein n=1 Tax=Brucella sp. BE17 TaxID=3142977 RepID=UPI0031BB6835
MKLKLFLFVSVACAAASGVKAADAIVEPAPVPVVIAPSFAWKGAYIGGQVGYGWSKSDFSSGFATFDKQKPDGFLGGLYAGYNFDLGNNVVLGIDGDITYNDVSKGINIPGSSFALGSFDHKLRWSGAVRARAGYAFDRFLPYIAGGVAFGSVKNNGDIYGVDFSESKTLSGWTVGGGFDYAATDNVILRLEYRYTDYGDKSHDFNGLRVKDDFKTNDVRLGVAYKF